MGPHGAVRRLVASPTRAVRQATDSRRNGAKSESHRPGISKATRRSRIPVIELAIVSNDPPGWTRWLPSQLSSMNRRIEV